jgi:hypothetical protein
MTEPEQSTVLGRLLAAGINPDRAAEHLKAGRVSVDGTIVTDPDTEAAKPVRVVLVAV